MRTKPLATALAIASGAGPLLLLVFLSFDSTAGFRLDVWRGLFRGTGDLLPATSLSISLSLTVAVLATALGFFAGRHVAYHRHRTLFLGLAYAPFVLSPVVLGASLLGVYLRAGLDPGLGAVLLSQASLAAGFATVFFTDFWNAEKRAIEDLVRTLGGTARDAYLRALLPIARPALALCLFQTFLVSWFQYGLTQLVGAGKVQTLPLRVYVFVGEANPGYAAASGLLLLAPPLALWALSRRWGSL